MELEEIANQIREVNENNISGKYSTDDVRTLQGCARALIEHARYIQECCT